MNRILVVQTAFLGDVVLTTPLLRELRRANPEVDITVLTTPLGAEVLAGLPYVDEIVPFDKRGAQRGVGATWQLAGRVRRARFDLGIAAQRSFRTGWLLWAARIRVRVGFEGCAGSWAYTSKVAFEPADHAVRRYLALAGPAGGDASKDPRPELAVSSGGRGKVRELLRGHGVAESEPLLALAPGSVWGTKRWVPEGYAEVARAAASRGLRAVLIGSPAERELCEQVAARAGEPAIVLAGRTTISEMTALLAMSRALVTNDSGPGHVASAVGTPVVAIFGPTVPAFGYTPFGGRNRIVQHPDLACRPCHPHGPQVCPLGHHRCMRELEPRRVIAALEEVLAAGGGHLR